MSDFNQDTQHELSQQLLGAATNNQLYKVQSLLEKGAPVNCQDKAGFTPLHYAARTLNGLSVMKALVEYGADLNIRDSFGRTAFIYAVSFNRLDCVRYLMDKQADINLPDNNNGNALHYAVHNKRLECIELLLKAGVDIDVVDDSGRTPSDGAFNDEYVEGYAIIKAYQKAKKENEQISLLIGESNKDPDQVLF